MKTPPGLTEEEKEDRKAWKKRKRSTGMKTVSKTKLTISGGNDEGVPPVPIPNTEVKPFSADGTWLVTARESRSPPDPIFLSSSMAEHSAVNRRVVGSSPTWGAEKSLINRSDFFFLLPGKNLNKLIFRQTLSRPAFSMVATPYPWRLLPFE